MSSSSVNERTHLLGNNGENGMHSSESAISKYGASPVKRDTTTVGHEAKVLFSYTAPLIATNLLRAVVFASSVYAVARMPDSTLYLAAANLGTLTTNVGGFAITLGITSALDTLANQASKSDTPKLTSIYTMRTFVVSCMAMPFLYIFLFNGNTIFPLVMPYAEPEMIRHAADYMKVLSLGLPGMTAFECIRRYLASVGLLAGPTIAFALTAPLAVFLNWLFVHGPPAFRIGFLGAALAAVLSINILFLAVLVYAYFKAPRHTWAGFSWVVFQDLGVVVRFGLAGIASTCSEWYAFEAVGLGASYLGATAQAATAIYNVTLSVCWQVPYSVSIAVSIRIGNLLGQNLPKKARKAALIAYAFTAAIVIVNALLLQIFKRGFAHLFTDDEAVVTLVDKSMYVLAIITIFDGLQAAGTGILKGAGLPGTAARVNLLSYWILGLPFGAFVTYKTRELAGLWSGLATAVFFAASFMCLRALTLNWETCAEEALQRLEASEEIAHTSNIVLGPDDLLGSD